MEVPYWETLLQFYEEDESGDERSIDEDETRNKKIKKKNHDPSGPLTCHEATAPKLTSVLLAMME